MKKRFTEAQIIGFLREAEAGLPVKDLCPPARVLGGQLLPLAEHVWRDDGVYGTSKSVFSGSARTCHPHGRGAPGGPRLRVGGAAVGGAEARLHGGDAAAVGAAGAA